MALPDFLIIGAMKGGTQAAVRNLARHPDVWLVDEAAKQALDDVIGYPEVHFFDKQARWELGTSWYERFFEPGRGYRHVGEKTPEYLSHLDAHARLREVVPGARLIVLLREPVSRAFSHWRHIVALRPGWDSLGLADLSFTQAVERVLEVAGRRQHPPDLLWKGCYARQLQHLQGFFPAEQIGVFISERVRVRMEDEYARMFRFIGAHPLINVTFSEFHVRDDEVREAPEAQAVDALEAYYRAHNEALYEMLGEAPAEWQSASGVSP